MLSCMGKKRKCLCIHIHHSKVLLSNLGFVLGQKKKKKNRRGKDKILFQVSFVLKDCERLKLWMG